MKPKISVIIPVYKVEPYLRQCLDSVVNQTYQNLEIIIVDDGSPDRCGEICDSYAARDSRVKVIHKENAGLSAAWNDGILQSSGEWTAFVDSDDWIDSTYYETLLETPYAKCADIILANGYLEEWKDSVVRRQTFTMPFIYDDKSEMESLKINLLSSKNKKERYDKNPYVWDKLYRTSFIKKNHFEFETKVRAGLGNDGLFNFIVLEKANTVCGVSCTGYHYRILNTAGTRKYDPNRPESVHYLLECFWNYIEKNPVSSPIQSALEAYAITNIISNMKVCFFHPQNQDSYQEIAKKIKRMKQMRCYNRAIRAKCGDYLTIKQRLLQIALRIPFIFPLKLMMMYTHERMTK